MDDVRKKKVACVILAAGLSKRFDGLKQLARLADDFPSLAQNAVDVANGSSADYVILVLGQSASDIAANTNLGRANLVFNKDYELGLSTSVKCGLSNVPADTEAALFMVADQPFLTSKILNRMIDSYRNNKSRIIALSSSGSEPRNPVLFERSMFPELEKLSGDVGARETVVNHIKEVVLLKEEDQRVLLDIDTREALEDAKRKRGAHEPN